MIVLDANAAVHMVRNTSEGRALSTLMMTDEPCHAPYLYVGEICNSLRNCVCGGFCNEREAYGLVSDALDLIDSFHADDELAAETLMESLRLNHPSYDMEYLVLARRLGATLFTLDQRLQTLALANGVNCISTEDFDYH